MKTLRSLAFIGVVAILGAIAVGTYFLGGYYSVAGTAPDPSLVAWALAQVRTASIEHHAKDNPPLSLDDPAIVQAGAHAYSERGCVNCHGGPGVKWAKFSEGLHPDPPDCSPLSGVNDGVLMVIYHRGMTQPSMMRLAPRLLRAPICSLSRKTAMDSTRVVTIRAHY